MQNLTPEGLRRVSEAAERHGVSLDAAVALLGALADGNGRQAQFNHPDLGGMGQWSQGGMIMIGDMFNHGLKARVDALCSELAGLLLDQPSLAVVAGQTPSQSQGGGGVSLFVDETDIAIGRNETLEVRGGPLAVRAIVVEERDDGDAAGRIAADGRVRVVQYGIDEQTVGFGRRTPKPEAGGQKRQRQDRRRRQYLSAVHDRLRAPRGLRLRQFPTLVT